MSFLTPIAWGLGILIPIVLALYLLKLRRVEHTVSSTFLWQRMVQDIEANAPWQQLKRNILLILQLIFLVFLILAIARPFTWVAGSNSKSVILIFDISASMGANDLQPNRLGNAKDQARLLISNLPDNTQSTIITAGESTQVIISSSQDRQQLYQALERIQPQPGGSDMIHALELASAIAVRQTDPEIVIFSDGGVELQERFVYKGPIRYISTGESGNNQAVSHLSLEPDSTDQKLVALVQVTNYDTTSATRRLTLNADGKLIDAHDLEIPARDQVTIISENIPKDIEVLEAALSGVDNLTIDDRRWVVQQDKNVQDVTLVSDGNRFLETALGLLPGIDLFKISFEEFESQQDGTKSLNNESLLIFDSHAPQVFNLDSSNLFYIGPISSTETFSITGYIDNPIPQSAFDNDPLLKFVDLNGVSFLDSARIPLPDWARPVLLDENSLDPLLFVGETEMGRVAVMAFDPRRSDLPLQVAYPILIANLMEWLLPGKIGNIPTQIRPGESLLLTPPSEVTYLTVTRPDGSTVQLDAHDGRVLFADTSSLGIYIINWGEDQQQLFSVNLSSSNESDITPNESLPGLSNNTIASENQVLQSRHEWWRLMAAIALTILIVEWLVYNQSALRKFIHQLKTTLSLTSKRKT